VPGVGMSVGMMVLVLVLVIRSSPFSSAFLPMRSGDGGRRPAAKARACAGPEPPVAGPLGPARLARPHPLPRAAARRRTLPLVRCPPSCFPGFLEPPTSPTSLAAGVRCFLNAAEGLETWKIGALSIQVLSAHCGTEPAMCGHAEPAICRRG